MSDPKSNKDDWQQLAEDVAACAYNVVSALAPDQETRDSLKKTCLEAQAKVLKGLLVIVEGKLGEMKPSEPPRAEKITID